MRGFSTNKVRAGAAATLAVALHCGAQSIHIFVVGSFPTCTVAQSGAVDAAVRGARCLTLAASVQRRYQANGRGGATADAEASDAGPKLTPEEQRVVDKAKPSASVREERLGFEQGETITENRLRTNYFILAKHYHPDNNPGHVDEATAAFTSIKDAYDVLLVQVKGGRSYTSGSRDFSGTDFGAAPHFADEARRRAMMQAMGQGVAFFMLASVIFIIVVMLHNRRRLNASYMWSLLGIFFIIQMFPRLLAAAMLFAVHCTYLVANKELTEQAAVTLLVREGPREVTVQLGGIDPSCAADVVVQVEVSVAPEHLRAKAGAAVAVAATTSTTITMDPGVTAFTVPAPPKGEERVTTYNIRAVDEKRKFVLVEKQFQAAQASK